MNAVKAPVNRRGRPPELVPADVAQRVLDWLSAGRPLSTFCNVPGNPARRTVHYWREKDPDFRRAFDIARDNGFIRLGEEMLEIVDKPPVDGRVTPGWLATQRLRVNARKWLMTRWFAKRHA